MEEINFCANPVYRCLDFTLLGKCWPHGDARGAVRGSLTVSVLWQPRTSAQSFTPINPVAVEIFRRKWELSGIIKRLLCRAAFWQTWSNLRTFWVIRGCIEFSFSKVKLRSWLCSAGTVCSSRVGEHHPLQPALNHHTHALIQKQASRRGNDLFDIWHLSSPPRSIIYIVKTSCCCGNKDHLDSVKI